MFFSICIYIEWAFRRQQTPNMPAASPECLGLRRQQPPDLYRVLGSRPRIRPGAAAANPESRMDPHPLSAHVWSCPQCAHSAQAPFFSRLWRRSNPCRLAPPTNRCAARAWGKASRARQRRNNTNRPDRQIGPRASNQAFDEE